MACYSPLTAYYSKDVNPSGKRGVVFNPRFALQPDDPFKLSCGQCIGCRLKYSSNWAVRCYHEAQMHEASCFVTLTFDDAHLPADGMIRVSDCQKFLKRLRRSLGGTKVRVAYCGEYGELNLRPHYHFLIFGFGFPDRRHWSTRNGFKYYRSPMLEKLWKFGNSLVCDFSFETAAYVSRYMLKKQKGKSYEDNPRVNYVTGEVLEREFFHTSRRPGIGSDWFRRFASDVFPTDEVVINGRRMAPPKFYDTQFQILDPYTMDDVKARRVAAGRDAKVAANNTFRRLRDREEVKMAQINSLARRFEHEE